MDIHKLRASIKQQVVTSATPQVKRKKHYSQSEVESIVEQAVSQAINLALPLQSRLAGPSLDIYNSVLSIQEEDELENTDQDDTLVEGESIASLMGDNIDIWKDTDIYQLAEVKFKKGYPSFTDSMVWLDEILAAAKSAFSTSHITELPKTPAAKKKAFSKNRRCTLVEESASPIEKPTRRPRRAAAAKASMSIMQQSMVNQDSTATKRAIGTKKRTTRLALASTSDSSQQVCAASTPQTLTKAPVTPLARFSQLSHVKDKVKAYEEIIDSPTVLAQNSKKKQTVKKKKGISKSKAAAIPATMDFDSPVPDSTDTDSLDSGTVKRVEVVKSRIDHLMTSTPDNVPNKVSSVTCILNEKDTTVTSSNEEESMVLELSGSPVCTSKSKNQQLATKNKTNAISSIPVSSCSTPDAIMVDDESSGGGTVKKVVATKPLTDQLTTGKAPDIAAFAKADKPSLSLNMEDGVDSAAGDNISSPQPGISRSSRNRSGRLNKTPIEKNICADEKQSSSVETPEAVDKVLPHPANNTPQTIVKAGRATSTKSKTPDNSLQPESEVSQGRDIQPHPADEQTQAVVKSISEMTDALLNSGDKALSSEAKSAKKRTLSAEKPSKPATKSSNKSPEMMEVTTDSVNEVLNKQTSSSKDDQLQQEGEPRAPPPAQPVRMTRSKMRAPPPPPPHSVENTSAKSPTRAAKAKSPARTVKAKSPARSRIASADRSVSRKEVAGSKRKPHSDTEPGHIKRSRTSSDSDAYRSSNIVRTLTKAASSSRLNKPSGTVSRLQSAHSTPDMNRTHSFVKTMLKGAGRTSPQTTPSVGRTVISFLNRATPKKALSKEEQLEIMGKKLKEKQEAEKQRLEDAERHRLHQVEMKKRERMEKMKKVQDAREAKIKALASKHQELEKKSQQKAESTSQAQEKKMREEKERALLREQKLQEAEERRKKDEQQRLKKLKASEAEQKRHADAIVRKKEYEEAERQKKIQEADKQSKMIELAKQEALRKITEGRLNQAKPALTTPHTTHSQAKTSVYGVISSKSAAMSEQRKALQSAVTKQTATQTSASKRPGENLNSTFTKEEPQNYIDIRITEEEDEFEDPKFSKCKKPAWATGVEFHTSVINQCKAIKTGDVNPALIFGKFARCMPDLTEMFPVHKPRFFHRTSSAMWSSPPISQATSAKRTKC